MVGGNALEPLMAPGILLAAVAASEGHWRFLVILDLGYLLTREAGQSELSELHGNVPIVTR